MRVNGKTVGYYNTLAASYGLQAGAQTFGYAMFLMNDSALDYLKRSQGWEVGVGPTVVIMDEGLAKSLTTSSDCSFAIAVLKTGKVEPECFGDTQGA